MYLKQIFQLVFSRHPEYGHQSVNTLLQSSVNSFGSVAMAGYTAANNILGFLYMSANAVTQACISFTSQNYGAGKPKRMERVLIDCMILSCGILLVLGTCAYMFGGILRIYIMEADVIKNGMAIFSCTTIAVFPVCGIMDLFPERCVEWDIQQYR